MNNITTAANKAMSNAQKNAAFLAATDSQTKKVVLANIAAHYGINSADVLDEVTGEGAEHLLDYVTGPERAAVSLLMKRHNLC